MGKTNKYYKMGSIFSSSMCDICGKNYKGEENKVKKLLTLHYKVEHKTKLNLIPNKIENRNVIGDATCLINNATNNEILDKIDERHKDLRNKLYFND